MQTGWTGNLRNNKLEKPITIRDWLRHAAGAIFALLLTITAACLFSSIVLLSFYIGVEISERKAITDFKKEVQKIIDANEVKKWNRH